MASKEAHVNGIRMRWEEEGAGPPVVLLHGLPTSPRLWRDVTPLVEGARTLAWEMVGYGDSIAEGRGRDLSVAAQAEYLVSWMQEIGLDRAVLVGHDLGGGVAQIAAVRHPERVSGLVFGNTICYDNWPVLPIQAMAKTGAVVEQLPDELFRYALYALFQQGHDRPDRIEEAKAEHWPPYAAAEERAAEAFVRQVQALDVHDTLAIVDRLPDLDVPARIVWGAAHRFLKIGYGYRLAYDLDAPLDRIEGGKHFVPEDHPKRLAAAVQAVLGEVA